MTGPNVTIKYFQTLNSLDESIIWIYKHRELYKKDLHDPDNHDGVITYLEPDILEWEVKWAIGSITTKKVSDVLSAYYVSGTMLSMDCLISS